MKFLFLCIFAILSLSICYSQTADVKIETSIVQSNYFDVKLYIKRNGTNDLRLGNASFVFNYNTSALLNPIEQQEGIFDNNTSQYYGDQFISNYNNTSESVEIYYLGQNGQGTMIPLTYTLLGIVRFQIQNQNSTHNVSWNLNYSAITNDEGIEVTQNLNFINPPNGILPVNESISNHNIQHDYLNQNYPNPFNSTTKFKYGIAKDGFIKLVIFDNVGRENYLFSGFHKSGEFSIDLNLNNYSSGIYYIKMITVESILQNKMILIK